MKPKPTKKKPAIICHRKFSLPTQDDWYPNRIRNTVEISVYEYTIPDKHNNLTIRVCVWGDDDFGLEKDMFFPNSNEKEKALKEILREVDDFPNPLNQDWLRDRGFYNA